MAVKVYTPDEVATILQISKHTVYELIKREELKAFKVGNKMRIQDKELESYMESHSTFSVEKHPVSTDRHSSDPLKLCGSHDLMLEKLCQIINENPSLPLNVQAFYNGSLEGCMSLFRNECDMTAVHLFDPVRSEYNVPVIDQFFSGSHVTAVHLSKRKQGLLVKKGNPKHITGWKDLTRNDVTFINRQPGSGTRQLIDNYLKKHSIQPGDISGYENVEWTHYAAAAQVTGGIADVCAGIEAVADILGLTFIPVTEESFDLILKWNETNNHKLAALLDALQSPSVRALLSDLSGYNIREMGRIIYPGNIKNFEYPLSSE